MVSGKDNERVADGAVIVDYPSKMIMQFAFVIRGEFGKGGKEDGFKESKRKSSLIVILGKKKT
jgi:hypothetical protein